MMNRGFALCAVMSVWAGSSAWASTKAYQLKMDLSIDGKHVSSPQVLVHEGKPVTVIQEDGLEKRFIEIIATPSSIQNRSAVLMKFVIGTIDENGLRKIVAKPQVIAREGRAARITQGDPRTHAEQLSLSVTARKSTL